MGRLSLIVFVAIVFIGGYLLVTNKTSDSISEVTEEDTMMQEQEHLVSVDPIEHATMVLTWGDVTIYTDPVGGAEAFVGKTSPNIILVTDVHGDHLSAETLAGVIAEETVLIAPQAVIDELPEALAASTTLLANEQTITVHGITITGMPMYNHADAENSNYHTKGRGNGYLLEKDGYRVYIAGDTAGIPEMRALTNIDMAFVPMNLPYTMDVEEAADAVLAFAPAHVYPYHYRGPDGLADVVHFKELVNAGNPNIDVQLLAWYSQN